jgi:hypothetical protein
VTPGNHIYAFVKYDQSLDSYNMYISCKETGWSVSNNIPVEGGKTYTDAYFVVEHQPGSFDHMERNCFINITDDCGQYPGNGQITFFDINIELDFKPVTPSWKGHKCTFFVFDLVKAALRL